MNNEFGKVSLELAKKMKELGFKQKSEWYWIVETGDAYIENENNLFGVHNDHLEDIYSAFTVAELGKMLPEKAYTWFNGKEWVSDYEIFTKQPNIGTGTFRYSERTNTEADCRAKMLIWLKEK